VINWIWIYKTDCWSDSLNLSLQDRLLKWFIEPQFTRQTVEVVHWILVYKTDCWSHSLNLSLQGRLLKRFIKPQFTRQTVEVNHWILVYKTDCWSDSLNYRYDNIVPVDEVFFCNYLAVGSISLSPVGKSQRPRPSSHFSFDVINSAALMPHTEDEGYYPFGCDVV
jgi:hypothetical protein